MAREAWVDKEECISCGVCVANLPAVFRFDESGKAECHDSAGASEAEIQASAIDLCPVACIYWKD